MQNKFFSHCPVNKCTACIQAAIVEPLEFVDLMDPCPLASLHLHIELDVYGVDYFHWAAWISCPAVLPPSSCTPAH